MTWRIADSKYAMPAVAAAIVLLFANVVLDGAFRDVSSWGALAVSAMPFVLAATAAVPSLLSGRGGIDVSIGPVMSLVNATIMGVLVWNGVTSPLAIVSVTLGIGLFAGLLNGVLVAYVRVPAIIATLGTYFVFASLAFIVIPASGGSTPEWLASFRGQWGPIPSATVFLLAVVVVWMLLSSTSYVRNLLATGSDDRAAYTAGVHVDHVRLVAYILGGLVASIAGLALTASIGSGDAGAGTPYTLFALAGAALGGVSLAGGRGGMLGAAVGGFIFFLIQNLLTAMNVSVFALDIATGIIVLVAVGLNSLGSYLERRRARLTSGSQLVLAS